MFCMTAKQSIITVGLCDYCNGRVFNIDGHKKCLGSTCLLHKKCFKQMIKETNNLAIKLKYMAKFNKKNIPCRCTASGF